jgi:putative membrane protein
MENILEALQKGTIETVVYALLGIIFCVIGFKVVDFLMPGNLAKQITDEKNLPVAIVAAAMIIGICIIVAAAISG